MAFQKSEIEKINSTRDTIWVVMDVRTAQQGIVSGISRFVIGITKALVIALYNKKKQNDSPSKKIRVLVVSKFEPAQWIVELVHEFPDTVSFWSGGPGGLRKAYDKPTWLWATFVLKRIQKIVNSKVIWFAPANFDRPLFVANKGLTTTVVQVVHDSIPFMKVKGVGFLFRRQFKFLVRRALSKLPYVATVSKHSAEILSSLVKKRTYPLHIISDAVDMEFGAKHRIVIQQELASKRQIFFQEICRGTLEQDSSEIKNKFLNSGWVLGVGRNQKYKCWDMVLQAIHMLNSLENRKFDLWFVRVGSDEKEISMYAKKCPLKEFCGIKVFENLKIIVLPTLLDEHLAEIYRISHLLVHPSLAEGFGLPPLEAALSGTPVIFRQGTAVDQHFSKDSLPENYWCGVDSSLLTAWANQIANIFLDPKDSDFYKELNKSSSTRDFIVKYSNSKKFEWSESANALLNILIEESYDNMSNSLNKKK